MHLESVRLVAIVGPPVVDPAHIVEHCRAAADGGVTAVQVRWKHAPAAELYRVTRAVVESISVPVFVNDRADVAWAAGAFGVHVGTDDIAVDRLRAVAPVACCIGLSVGDEVEARAAVDVNPDYWSIGSVFATGTKTDAGAPIGVDGFAALAALAPPGVSVIAIGGIDAGNAAGVFERGADGIAVSGALFAANDVTAAARELRRVVDRARPLDR